MAERRMISKAISESDWFYEMSTDAQALYLHIVVNSDDDGACNRTSMLSRLFKAGAFDELVLNELIIPFPQEGCSVVTHWPGMNKVQPSRYIPTLFPSVFARLVIRGGRYWMREESASADGRPFVDEESEQERLGEISSELRRPGKGSASPTLDEVIAFFRENQLVGDPERFYRYYSAMGWRNKAGTLLNDWRAKARQWSAKDAPKVIGFREGERPGAPDFDERRLQADYFSADGDGP